MIKRTVYLLGRLSVLCCIKFFVLFRPPTQPLKPSDEGFREPEKPIGFSDSRIRPFAHKGTNSAAVSAGDPHKKRVLFRLGARAASPTERVLPTHPDRRSERH